MHFPLENPSPLDPWLQRNEVSEEKRALRVPGGAGSKMRVCISDGRLEYTGRMMSSGTLGPRLFMRSHSTWHAVSISSWPARSFRMLQHQPETQRSSTQSRPRRRGKCIAHSHMTSQHAPERAWAAFLQAAEHRLRGWNASKEIRA